MSYFTDYKRQMMGHNRYFEPPSPSPHDYAVDFRRNNFEGAFHHQHHPNTPYNELPARFSNSYGPAVGSHLHSSYENLMYQQQQQHHQMSAAARRTRESYQHESNPATAPYYYHNGTNNAGSPMMNSYYAPNESYRKDSTASASPAYHHWMANNGGAGNFTNSQYYPPSMSYGNSTPYYPTPPPSASPAGNFHPSKNDHRLPSYEYDYYNKEKTQEIPANDHNQGYAPSYNESIPANRPLFSPKMDYHINHTTPEVEGGDRKHFESQHISTEQMKSPTSSESDNYRKTKEPDRDIECEKPTLSNTDSSSHHPLEKFDSTFFKKSDSTENDDKDSTNEQKPKSKEIESHTGPENEYKTLQSSYANTLPEHNRDEFYESTQHYQQMTSDFHAHQMMPSSREMLNRVSGQAGSERTISSDYSCPQKRHKNWIETNKKSNRRYSLLESKSSPLENSRGNSFNEKKMMYSNLSPTVSRKRKFNSESRNDLKNDTKDTIPLPGFLQTFGQTEIGKFSEAFCSSSDSPFYNSIESDVDSPHMWEHDSLEGPVKMTTSFQICAADVNYDSSPLNNFGELICNEC